VVLTGQQVFCRDDDAPEKDKHCLDNREQLVWTATPVCPPTLMSALSGTNFNQASTTEPKPLV